MDALETFLAMGGYGQFVWPAYGLSAVVMIWLLIDTLRRLRAAERALERLSAIAPRRARSRPGDRGAHARSSTADNGSGVLS